MIPMDRETLMMIATIVAIAGVIFLFREMNKAKPMLKTSRTSQPTWCSVSVLQSLNLNPNLNQRQKPRRKRRNNHIRLL
jgi:hypothetical protein